MNHIPLALFVQICTVPVFGWWTGAAAGSFYFIGREYAQAEYRLIEHYYGGLRVNMPVFAPLKEARAWTRKSILDWVLPIIAVSIVAFLAPKILKMI